VKQCDLGEYEENAREKQNIQIYKIRCKLPLNPSHRDGKHQFPNSRWQQPKLKVSQWEKTILPLKPRQIKPSAKHKQRCQLLARKQNEKHKGLVK
jgi:hypothetical protein